MLDQVRGPSVFITFSRQSAALGAGLTLPYYLPFLSSGPDVRLGHEPAVGRPCPSECLASGYYLVGSTYLVVPPRCICTSILLMGTL